MAWFAGSCSDFQLQTSIGIVELRQYYPVNNLGTTKGKCYVEQWRRKEKVQTTIGRAL